MTAQEVINLAYKESKRNVPDVTADEATELLPVLYRLLVGFFQLGARINPAFFGDTDDIAFQDPGWARPATAEAVYGIEKADGTEIEVVPRDQKDAEPGFPSVYPWGQIYRIANDANGALQTTDTLTFFFSKIPDALPQLTSVIDPLWPERFKELLALELALYLARKESGERAEQEVPLLTPERDRLYQQFTAALEHETVGEAREFGRRETFNTPTIVPAGGSG